MRGNDSGFQELVTASLRISRGCARWDADCPETAIAHAAHAQHYERQLLEVLQPPVRRARNSSTLQVRQVYHLLVHQTARIHASTHACERSSAATRTSKAQKDPLLLSCSRADMPASGGRGCNSASLLAMRSIGIRTTAKNMDRMANPFAARVTTPWSQAKIASSYNRVTRSHRAVM